MAPTALNKAANLWVSRFIPVLLIGIVGYVSWVVIVLVCVKYLLYPPKTLRSPRPGVATAILVLYALLFVLMSWTYFRLLYTVTFNPGYVPLGPEHHEQEPKRKRRYLSSGSSSQNEDSHQEEKQTSGSPPDESQMTTEDLRDTEDFFHKDIYVCKGDGMPIWCSTCLIWKPDRTHHCREVDRCVRKMDHFCPWVGGVVSETSFNFFIQFTAWTSVFCIFNLVHMSVFMAEYRRITGTANVHWIITLALAALFALFTLGMTGSSIQYVLLNTTTIENLSRRTLVWDLAVRIYQPPTEPARYATVSFSPSQMQQSHEPNAENGSGDVRRYAILHSKPGDNPWNLGAYRNFQSVMGLYWYEWLFPLSYSPCCDHSAQESQFEVGPVVDQMMKDAGISWSEETISEKTHSRRRHRRRRRRRRRSFSPPTDHSNGQIPPNADGNEGQTPVRDVADMV